MSNSDNQGKAPETPVSTGDPVRDALVFARSYLTGPQYKFSKETADVIARIDAALKHHEEEIAALRDLNEPEEPDDESFLLDEEEDDESFIVDDQHGLIYRVDAGNR